MKGIKDMKKRLSPYLIIVLSFLAVIGVGTLLLLLPFSTYSNVDITAIDTLFTAASAVTITGLTTVNVFETFTVFGKIIIGMLVQIGGLSVTTITLFILTIIGSKLSFSSRELAKESANVDSRKGIVGMIKKIVVLALIIESVGTAFFTIFFLIEGYGFFEALGLGAFHTVSSYNNAGYSIFISGNSLVSYQANWFFNLATMILITLGGLGAVVIIDVWRKKNWEKFSFHTKIVLKTSLILFLFGGITFYILETDATILQALFHSTTLRTAGFHTYDYGKIANATKILMMLLMFIGAAPASTGGGIKVTTLYTIVKSGVSFIDQKEPVAYQRKIPSAYQIKAFMIVFFSGFIIITGLFLLSLLEKNISLSALLFEVISAFSNTGLDSGVTVMLRSLSKIIIIILMFIGRIGIITFINIFHFRETRKSYVDYIDINYLI